MLILIDLDTHLKFGENEFVAGRGTDLCSRERNAAGPNESTVAGKPHPLTCPLNPTPIRRLAFPAGDRENKKGGKEAAETGRNPHFCPRSRVPNEISRVKEFLGRDLVFDLCVY